MSYKIVQKYRGSEQVYTIMRYDEGDTRLIISDAEFEFDSVEELRREIQHMAWDVSEGKILVLP